MKNFLRILLLSCLFCLNLSAEIIFEIPTECIISVENHETFEIIEYHNADDHIAHQIIAAVGVTYLPEILRAICKIALNDEDQRICDVVYNATSVLVALRGKKIYKGITHGFEWSAAKGPTRGIVKVNTKTYSNVALFKRIFSAYRSSCTQGNGINWESISEFDYSKEIAEYGVGNESCQGVKKNLENLYNCSYQNLLMKA